MSFDRVVYIISVLTVHFLNISVTIPLEKTFLSIFQSLQGEKKCFFRLIWLLFYYLLDHCSDYNCGEVLADEHEGYPVFCVY